MKYANVCGTWSSGHLGQRGQQTQGLGVGELDWLLWLNLIVITYRQYHFW